MPKERDGLMILNGRERILRARHLEQSDPIPNCRSLLRSLGRFAELQMAFTGPASQTSRWIPGASKA
jgi:hypothetical protein